MAQETYTVALDAHPVLLEVPQGSEMVLTGTVAFATDWAGSRRHGHHISYSADYAHTVYGHRVEVKAINEMKAGTLTVRVRQIARSNKRKEVTSV